MKGQIVTYDAPRGWGFIDSDGGKFFFHVKNSRDFTPVLGAWVEFDTAPPFKLGQREQAMNLRAGGAS